MAQRVTPLGHVLSPEVELGRERVVSWAVQGQVGSGVGSALAERLSMVKLETVCFSTALTTSVDERAARTIALVDCSAHSRRDVAAAPSSI